MIEISRAHSPKVIRSIAAIILGEQTLPRKATWAKEGARLSGAITEAGHSESEAYDALTSCLGADDPEASEKAATEFRAYIVANPSETAQPEATSEEPPAKPKRTRTKNPKTPAKAKDKTPPKASTAKAKTTAKTPAKAKDKGDGTKGRKSKYAGKRIFAAMKDNPRREETWGWKSYNIIKAAGKRGITYENFLAKGGRLKDLAWDDARGDRVRIE